MTWPMVISLPIRLESDVIRSTFPSRVGKSMSLHIMAICVPCVSHGIDMNIKYCFYLGYNEPGSRQQKNKKARLIARGRYIDPLQSAWLSHYLKNSYLCAKGDISTLAPRIETPPPAPPRRGEGCSAHRAAFPVVTRESHAGMNPCCRRSFVSLVGFLRMTGCAEAWRRGLAHVGRQECPPHPHTGFLSVRAPTRDAPTQATWRTRRRVVGFFSLTSGQVIR